MEIGLTPEMDIWIRSKVSIGAFETETQAIHEALRVLISLDDVHEPRLATFETLDDLKQMVEEGRNSPVVGELDMEEITKEVEWRLAARKVKEHLQGLSATETHKPIKRRRRDTACRVPTRNVKKNSWGGISHAYRHRRRPPRLRTQRSHQKAPPSEGH